MAPENQSTQPVETGEKPVDDSNEHYKPVIEANAHDRAEFTRRSFEAIGKSLTEFLAEIKKPPYNIEIDEKDDKSLAYGMFCFQRLLGPPEVEIDFLHDGMCGPATLKKYKEVKERDLSKSSLGELRATLSSAPKSTDTPVQPERKEILTSTDSRETMLCGDSITTGFPVPESIHIEPKVTYYTDKEGKRQKHVTDLAVVGQQTGAVLEGVLLAEQQGALDKTKAANVLCGINDLASGRSVEQTKNGLLAIYEKFASKNIRILACTITPWTKASPEVAERINKVNEWIKNEALAKLHEKHPAAVMTTIDTYTEVKNNPLKYPQTQGGLHFTVESYAALADYILSKGNIDRKAPEKVS